jgi:cytochrome c553
MMSKPWRGFCSALVAAAMGIPFGTAAAQSQTPLVQPPAWAYPLLGPDVPVPKDDGSKLTLSGSKLEVTSTQLFDIFAAYDWYPQDHPPMPEVVAHGRKPEVRACGMCHLPNGQGRPENATLASLPAAHIEQQMADYKSGLRRTSQPKAGPHIRMLATALDVSGEKVRAAAAYFSKITYRPWIRVVETDTVPKTEVVIGSLWVAAAGGGTEPIGQRIVEIPEDLHRTELRDPTSGFVAYVPMSSIEKGATLVTTGDGGRTLPCTACHGLELKGVGTIPPLAGRSTSYIIRHLYDIQHGTRAGMAALPMKEVVTKLTLDDMLAIAAYVGSRAP